MTEYIVTGEEIDTTASLNFDEMCEEKKAWDKKNHWVVIITPYKQLGQIKIEYIDLDEEVNTLRQYHATIHRNFFPKDTFYRIKPKSNSLIDDIKSSKTLQKSEKMLSKEDFLDRVFHMITSGRIPEDVFQCYFGESKIGWMSYSDLDAWWHKDSEV